MIRTTLEQLGLTESEVKIYLTILALKQVPGSIIAKKCGLKRSNTYFILDKMIKKGYITCITKKNLKHFSAIDPDILLDKFKTKASILQHNVNNLEKFLPILRNLKGETKGVNVEFFEGLEGIKSMLYDIIKSNTPQLCILKYDICPKVLSFLENEYTPERRKQKNATSKIIALQEEKHNQYIENNFNKTQIEQRFLSKKYLNLDVSVQIYNNKVSLFNISNTNNLYGIRIESKTVANTFKSVFALLWELAKV